MSSTIIKENRFQELIDYVKTLYSEQGFIPLHAPVFSGNEKKYLNDCIDSTFVSYIGKYVSQFEDMIASYTGAKHAVAVVNGTVALQIALEIIGTPEPDQEVITQPLTFVATANAIAHTGSTPVFVDVDLDTLGMSPKSLSNFFEGYAIQKGSATYNKSTGRKIKAVMPMHTFGHPCRIDEIIEIADRYNLPVVEDAAESLGSSYKGRHTGTFGKVGVVSFNGNKTITAGGGGMIITDDEAIALRAKHITTTAKMPHDWEYIHDEIGYNFRLTNVSAALGVAQMEQLPEILLNKRDTAEKYAKFCNQHDIPFVSEPSFSESNYWLNAIVLGDRKERDRFLRLSNDYGVMTRPIWRLMNGLKMYEKCQSDKIENSQWLEERVVNIPSGVRGLQSL